MFSLSHHITSEPEYTSVDHRRCVTCLWERRHDQCHWIISFFLQNTQSLSPKQKHITTSVMVDQSTEHDITLLKGINMESTSLATN